MVNGLLSEIFNEEVTRQILIRAIEIAMKSNGKLISLGVVGSYLSGTYRKDSDIDIHGIIHYPDDYIHDTIKLKQILHIEKREIPYTVSFTLFCYRSALDRHLQGFDLPSMIILKKDCWILQPDDDVLEQFYKMFNLEEYIKKINEIIEYDYTSQPDRLGIVKYRVQRFFYEYHLMLLKKGEQPFNYYSRIDQALRDSRLLDKEIVWLKSIL